MEPKFKIGDIVIPDYPSKKMEVVDIFWEDHNPYKGGKDGCWVYRLAFLTRLGQIDKRKNFRRFNEAVITSKPNSENLCLKS